MPVPVPIGKEGSGLVDSPDQQLKDRINRMSGKACFIQNRLEQESLGRQARTV